MDSNKTYISYLPIFSYDFKRNNQTKVAVSIVSQEIALTQTTNIQ